MGARIAAHLANTSIPSLLLDIVPAGADPFEFGVDKEGATSC